MANTTIVYFERIWDYDNTTRIFRTVAPRRDILWVSSFENGIAIIKPMCGSMIAHVAEIVAGCFVNDKIRMYKKSNLKMYKNVHR